MATDKALIEPSLREEEVRIEANQVRTDFPPVDELRGISASILDEGLETFGKGMHFAALMGMQTSVLSEMRRSKRIVPFHVALGMMAHPGAAQVIIRRQCQLAGFPEPLLTTIVLDHGEAKALDGVRQLMRVAGLWIHFGAELARVRYGCTLDLLDAGIDGALRVGLFSR